MRVLELEMQDINNFYIANKVEKLTQNDDLQFIKLTFPNSLKLDIVELVVNYIPLSNLTITEVYSNLSKVFEFEINKKAVENFGTLNVEFALREKATKKYITHNKRIELQVMSDVNGSKTTIVAGTTLNELLKQMDLKKKEFDDNFKTKIDSLNPIIQEMAGSAIDEAIQSSKDGIQAVGNEQVTAVKNQGNTSLQAVTKVQSDIEALLRDQAVEGNALSLNGKTGPQYDKEIQGVAGGYSGNFPLDSAVLEGIYLVPQTGKFYVCTKAYKGLNLTAPNANFEELSVWKNRDRLSNLHGYELVVSGSVAEEIINVEQEIFDLNQYNKKTSQHHFISSLVLEIICITGTQHTSYGGQDSTQIIKYLILPANTVSPCKIGEISPIGVQLFNIKNNKIFYTAKHKENKYAVYINKLPIQFI